MKLVFMGTPQFAVPTFRKLLASSHEVVAVVTQTDKPAGRGEKLCLPPVKRLALQARIPVYQPEKLKAEDWQATFSSFHAQAFVVVAYGKILPVWLIGLPTYGAINLHASLLPKYRGAAPIQWAIANGEAITGVTTMKIDQGMDTGDILLQKEIEIEPQAPASELHDELAEVGAALMLDTLQQLETGSLTPIPQDRQLASYAPQLKKIDGTLVWSQPALAIYNRIRAFNPWPGTFTHLRGELLRIWKALPVDLMETTQPAGTLFHSQSQGAVVACGSGFLQLCEVQLEGRKRVSGADFLHGLRLPQNQSLQLGR